MSGKKSNLFLGLTLLTLAGGGGLAYMQYGKIGAAQTKLQELRGQARDKAEVERELEQTEEQLAQIHTELKHLEKSVPQMAYVPTMLAELERIGKENGIVVTGVKPMPEKVQPKGQETNTQPKPYKEIAIEVQGRGNYASVMRFVQALTRFPKIVAAENLSLSPVSGQQDNGRNELTVTIYLNAFLFPQTATERQQAASEEGPMAAGVPATAEGAPIHG